MEDAKIVIVVSGGVVQEVYTNSSDVKTVNLVDHDNLREEGMYEDERLTFEAKAREGMWPIY